MHELAIAQQVVRAVLAEMERRGATAVRSIDLEVGQLEGLRAETLRRAFAVEAEKTALEGAILNVTIAPATASCPTCKTTKPFELPWDPAHGPVRVTCPDCGSELVLTGGRGYVVQRATMILEDP